MSKDVEVSVIILTYFHEDYICRAIETVLKQKFEYSYEILISDDCSLDKTVEIAKKYQQEYPNKIFIHVNKENLGICRNEYEAYLRCRGKYIVLTAGDDQWIDNCVLQKQYDFLEKNKDFFAECNITKGFFTNGEPTGTISPNKRFWNKEFFREDFLNKNFFSTGGIMFRNVFDTKRGRKQFSLMPKFSRDIDDLTFCLFIFDFGRVHISNNVSYALTERRETDSNQHNFNTKYKGAINTIEHLKVISQLDKFYNRKYNFENWYYEKFTDLIYLVLKLKKVSLLSNMKYTPIKYWGKFVLRRSIELLKEKNNKEKNNASS